MPSTYYKKKSEKWHYGPVVSQWNFPEKQKARPKLEQINLITQAAQVTETWIVWHY